MKPWLRIVLLVAPAVAVAAGLAFWLSRGEAGGGIRPHDARLVAVGHGLYIQHCASCHGESLEGQPNWQVRRPDGRLPAPPHDASGHTWHHSDEQLFTITKHGTERVAPPGYRSDMRGFAGTLTDAQIWAVLSYVASTWPEAIQARQQAATDAAKAR